MFKKAAKIRIPTTVSFYLLTFLLSMLLLASLLVNKRAFCFGVATTLLAHGAVYLLTRERIPAWATLFILALVVPWFPPEALVPVERGALYWGILAGLVAYTLTYGAHYCLRLRSEDTGKEAKGDRRRKPDRHTSELFQLLKVTNFTQALRTIRKLVQERDRRNSDADTNDAKAQASETAQLQEKLKESHTELKQLRRRLDDSKQRLETQRRQMEDSIEQSQRRVEETIAAREQAEEKVESIQGFQLKVAELTQQTHALRDETQDKESLVQTLRTRVCSAESARDAARAECGRLESEIARLTEELQKAATQHVNPELVKETYQQQLSELTVQIQQAEARDQELVDRLQRSDEALATVRCELHSLRQELRHVRTQLGSSPTNVQEVHSQAARSGNERPISAGDVLSLRSQLNDKTHEVREAKTRLGKLRQTNTKYQKRLEHAQRKVTELEEKLAFHKRTTEELTPEIDRLDDIISRYEATYGPPPEK